MPHLPGNRITKLDPDARSRQHMNPQPLRIAQAIILRLHLGKHHLPPLLMPQKQIRNAATPLLIFLRHNLTNRC